MTSGIPDIPLRKAARIAGLGYVAIFIFAILASVAGIALGDPATTANNIMANELLFRSGIASWLIAYIADAVVLWALYILLKPVNKSLSLLAAWFRLIFVGISVITLFNLLTAVRISKGALGVFEPGQVQAQMMLVLNAYWDGVLISFVFFGLNLFFIGYLIFKSSYIPRILGVMLMVTSIGYQINSFANLVLPNLGGNEAILFVVTVGVPAIITELSLGLWLLVRGGKIPEMKS